MADLKKRTNDEETSAKLMEVMQSFKDALNQHGFTTDSDPQDPTSPDFVVKDKKGRTLVLEIKFKSPRETELEVRPLQNERLETAKNTLLEIRERNQHASERLEKLKQRLAAA